MRGWILEARLKHPRAGMPALAGALIVGMLHATPAGAQWIGSPGGSGDGASGSGNVTITAPAPAPGMQGGLGSGFEPAPQPVPQQANPNMAECQTSVQKLRNDLEARGGAVQKAAKAKRPPSELCPLFRNLATAQQAFYAYLNGNKAKCGVPDDVLQKLKANNSQVATTRNRVCEVAKMQENGGGGGGGGPSGPPAQGSVSAGLGLPSGLPSVGTEPGGVFDTLGGDALR